MQKLIRRFMDFSFQMRWKLMEHNPSAFLRCCLSAGTVRNIAADLNDPQHHNDRNGRQVNQPLFMGSKEEQEDRKKQPCSRVKDHVEAPSQSVDLQIAVSASDGGLSSEEHSAKSSIRTESHGWPVVRHCKGNAALF